jgi:hypothetical protein
MRTGVLVAPALLGAGLVLAAACPAAGQLCEPSADPCEVTGIVELTNPSQADELVIDLSDRELVIRSGGSLTVRPGAVRIQAGSVVVESGASLRAPGEGGTGGTVTLVAVGAIRVESGAAGPGLVSVSAGDVGGDVNLVAGGPIRVDGLLEAAGTNRDAFGGTVAMSGESIALAGPRPVDAQGGNRGLGGVVVLDAVLDVTIDGPVAASAGEEGGSIDVLAGGSITTRPAGALEVDAAGAFGDGGDVFLDARRAITIDGRIGGHAAGSSNEGGGLGADVVLLADGNVTVGGVIDASGASPDGEGGVVDAVAGLDLRLTGAILAPGPGREGCGGDVGLRGDTVHLTGPINVSGGDCGGGGVVARGRAAAVATVEINADGTGGPGGGIAVGAMAVDVSGNLHASGTGGGFIDLHGCELSVSAQARLTTAGARGQNTLKANERMFISPDAVLTAGQTNRIVWDAERPDLVGRLINPPPIVEQQTLPPCPGTPVPTTTSTSSTTSSSTTTSTTTSTSTTSVTTTSSTSTTARSTTTTTTSTTMPVMRCTPEAPLVCDDLDDCTADRCEEQQCVHEPEIELRAVSCRLDKIETAIVSAPRADIPMRKTYERRIRKVQRLVEAASFLGGQRAERKLQRAKGLLAAFRQLVDRRATAGKLEPDLAAELRRLADETAGQMTPLLSAPE